MFDTKLLSQKIESLHLPIEENAGKIRVQYFSSNDFTFDSEQVLFLASGKGVDFAESADFWIQSILCSYTYLEPALGPKEYVTASLLNDGKMISTNQASAIMHECVSTLAKSTIFDWPDKPIHALLMEDEWNEKLLLLECAQEYITFHWFTTA